MKKGAGGNSGAFLSIWQAFIVAVLQKNTHIVERSFIILPGRPLTALPDRDILASSRF
jgi:hypothetical protein